MTHKKQEEQEKKLSKATGSTPGQKRDTWRVYPCKKLFFGKCQFLAMFFPRESVHNLERVCHCQGLPLFQVFC